MNGIGVMFQSLFGNSDWVDIYNSALGKTIKSAELDPSRGDGGSLILRFTDDTAIEIWDAGRSCCESRYITTDDDLSAFSGSIFNNIEIRDGGTTESEYGDPHEIQFLVVNTSLGSFTLETHNEHNGYYGGFWIKVDALDSDNE